ncbi:hypothetical protein D3C72_2024060 [compost metagenome]
MTLADPYRSAIMPVKGWAMPQVRFCTAIAMAKVSRLQPRSIETGSRNSPCTWRTPRARPMTMPPASTSSHSREASG